MPLKNYNSSLKSVSLNKLYRNLLFWSFSHSISQLVTLLIMTKYKYLT